VNEGTYLFVYFARGNHHRLHRLTQNLYLYIKYIITLWPKRKKRKPANA
jgi:hypothetical protein